MMSRKDPQTPATRTKRYLVLAFPRYLPEKVKNYSLIAVLVVGTNFFTHKMWNPSQSQASASLIDKVEASDELYLMEKARAKVADPDAFDSKVREVSDMLAVPPEWLMAVMYAESSFDPGVMNRQGSGATGLIQFMPGTAGELGVSLERLRRMDAVQQLEYVYLYLQRVRERYGEYEHLTDLYLAILYPKARGQDYCYTLYAKPSQSYVQNSGLDDDKDGRVTVSDVDKHLKRIFPKAFMTPKIAFSL